MVSCLGKNGREHVITISIVVFLLFEAEKVVFVDVLANVQAYVVLNEVINTNPENTVISNLDIQLSSKLVCPTA